MVELLKDNRIYGRPRYYFGNSSETLMQIPDEIRKCVVFIGHNTDMGMDLKGTAFFVEEEGGHDTRFIHLITAKHVLESWAKDPNAPIYLRVNLKNGKKDCMPTQYAQWIPHPDDSVDIIAIPNIILPDDMDIDIMPYPLMKLLNDDVIKEYEIGIGEDVFLPGLFTRHFGEEKNIPIVRTGNIAAMPDEKIEGEILYLIECRSIGGLSGSPVFVHLGITRQIDCGTAAYIPNKEGFDYPFYLLGVTKGHWDTSESELDMFTDGKGNRHSINMGIAKVIPISNVIETVNQPSVAAMKAERIKERKRESLSVDDSTDGGITRDQFHQIVKKAAQPIKKPKSDSKTL